MPNIFYKVKLKEFRLLKSGKDYYAESYDGRHDFIPTQFVAKVNEFDNEYSDRAEGHCEVWIDSWILEKKNIQYSKKTSAYFGKRKDGTFYPMPKVEMKTHTPEKLELKEVKVADELKK